MTDDTPRIKLLTFSTLYPNANNPVHGSVVETRLRHLLASGNVEAKVVAPVPWFPSANRNFGKFSEIAKIPKQENRYNINIFHPRYPLLPKIGRSLTPISLAAACMPLLNQLIRQGRNFNIIDARCLYPDGMAAAIIGRQLKKPVVITVEEQDFEFLPRKGLGLKMFQRTANQAFCLVAASAAIKEKLSGLGADPGKIMVLSKNDDPDDFRTEQEEIPGTSSYKRIFTTILQGGESAQGHG